ncbi:hypothetical protein Tco_1324653, partial [Tanacetum coccineum]
DDESSDDDDDDDDDDVEEDEEGEKEEHLAPVDSSTEPTIDPVLSAKDTKAFKTDESGPTPPSPRSRRARISVKLPSPMSASMEERIAEYDAALTPPLPLPSQLTLLSSPLPQIPSPPLPIPSPTTRPTYPEAPLGYRAAGIQLRAASPPLLLPSTAHRDVLPKADMPLRKRARFTTPTGKFEVGESSSAVAARQTGHTLAHRIDYGFVDIVDASICASESKAMTVVGEVNKRVTDLVISQRQDTQELY